MGGVCDPSHLLIMFDLRVIGLGDEVVRDITSSGVHLFFIVSQE